MNVSSVHRLIEIGKVNVEDPDDWDSVDKTYYWHNNITDQHHYLNSNTGTVYLKNLKSGIHELKFTVNDRWYQHQSQSTMNVRVLDLPLNAVINSGSLRIVGLDSFHFIAIWDWKSRKRKVSLKEQLEQSLKHIIDCDVVQIFSIIDHSSGNTAAAAAADGGVGGKVLDVRYFAKLNGRFLSAVYLNGIVQQHSNRLSTNLTV